MLRSAEGEVPLEGVNWEALHRRILRRATLPLARLRYRSAARAGAGAGRRGGRR